MPRVTRPANKATSICGIEVKPGERQQINLPIADLSIHLPITMPVSIVNGKLVGPRLFVSAVIHGDELNGVEIVRRVMQLPVLRRIRGTLIAVPLVNVPGFLNLTRTTPDGRDINRTFPGLSKGSLAARIAKLFFEEVVVDSDYGIDLHTGSSHRVNYPQIRGNLNNPDIENMALAFGVPLILNASSRTGSLREAAENVGVPVIVYEAGEGLRFDESAIRAGVKGVVRVMRRLGMLPARSRTVSRPLPILRSSSWIRAPISGILRTAQAAGTHVKKNQLLGVIADPLGESELEIRAPKEGFVIGRTNLPVVHEGDALFNLAQTEGTQIVARALDVHDPMKSISRV